jgi:hypothetical protein
MMKLREDEIEALLKFDGAVLQVLKNDDLLAQASHTYTAIITIGGFPVGIDIARADDSRVRAVRKAWEVYLLYKKAPLDERENGYWLYEQAMSTVTKMVATTNKEKQNG